MSKKLENTKRRIKRIAYSYQGYTPYSIIKEKTTKTIKKTGIIQRLQWWKKPKEQVIHSSYRIRCGPLKGNQQKILDLEPGLSTESLMTPEHRSLIEQTWEPKPQLTVFDHTEKKSLTAAQAVSMRTKNSKWMPMYYQNPMQSYDYLVYESLFKNTIIGPVMTQLVKFIVGTGFEPQLELRNPTNDKEADKKLIESNIEIINKLKYIDRCINEKSDEEGIDSTLQVKLSNLILNMLVFNRGCAVFGYDEDHPITIDGKTYADIPTSLTEYHPRDMGLIKISPVNQKMISLQIQQRNQLVKVNDMIYLWNSEFSAPIYLSKYYGGSMCMPMISAARLMQNQLTKVLPATCENMGAGLYHTYIEPAGGTEEQKELEYQSITQATSYGTASVFMIDPERVRTDPINFDPKIQELMGMFGDMVKYITATAKLPQIGFFDEAAANHATAVEKIQLTMSTSINPTREWIGDEFARQWYNRIFRILYKDDKTSLDTFRIKVSFEDLQVETLMERTKSVSELNDVGIKLDDEKLEELLQIEGMADHTVNSPTMPNEGSDGTGMQSKNRYEVKNKDTGGRSIVTQK